MIAANDRKVAMKSVNIRNGVARTVCILIAFALGSIASFAQNQRPGPMPSSELGRDNFSRVAASATELKAVLIKDSGLMVELKRWVAKDATDHGQIISDSDLTNDAIFDRLENDSQFRSIATGIVQKYGYLLPRVNPESDLGKERELLIKERTQWLAQRQEEELATARQKNSRNQQNARNCDPQMDSNCEASQSNSSTNRDGAQGRPSNQGQGSSSPNGNPEQSNPSNLPRDNGNPPERDRLLQTAEYPPNNFPQDQFGDRSDLSQSLNGLGQNLDGALSGNSLQPPMGSGEDGQSGSQLGGALGNRDDRNSGTANSLGSNSTSVLHAAPKNRGSAIEIAPTSSD